LLRKTQSRDRAALRVLESAKRVHSAFLAKGGHAPPPPGTTVDVRLGRGDGAFGASRRGLQAVPTTAMERSYLKLSRRLEATRPKSNLGRPRWRLILRKTHEFRTTVCCWRGGAPTRAAPVERFVTPWKKKWTRNSVRVRLESLGLLLGNYFDVCWEVRVGHWVIRME
jgi:hypothetical protein